MASPGPARRMCITAPADDRKGWTDGPARDPDRVTGSADRHRSRRASARRAATTPYPHPGPPARADRPVAPPGDERQPNHRRRPRVSPSSPSIVDPPDEATPILLPASLRSCPRPTAADPRRTRQLAGKRPAYVIRRTHRPVACRWCAAGRPSYGRSGASDGMPHEGSGSHGREDARGGWGRRIARSSPFDPRGAHRPRGLTPRVSPPSLADGRPADRPTIGSRPRRGLAPGQPKNNRRTIEERCSSQATGPSVP